MALTHIIKLSVGSEAIADLQAWQNHVSARRKAAGQPPLPVHVTRMFPKRRGDLLLGGSIYWVLKGHVLCRQRILDLFPEEGADGISRCAIRLDSELVPTVPVPRKPFQGWRYLKPGDAPADIAPSAADEKIPAAMRRELQELCLI